MCLPNCIYYFNRRQDAGANTDKQGLKVLYKLSKFLINWRRQRIFFNLSVETLNIDKKAYSFSPNNSR